MHRPYAPCSGKRAAELLGLSDAAWDARRAKATLWFELGGGSTPVAAGTRPKRSPNSLPVVGIAPPYLGVCLPGASWVFDERAVSASANDPVYSAALAGLPAQDLLTMAMRMHALLEDKL